ncbi:hypothetical protein GH714_030763 [Hevea brasiliensis]|uniref:Uncharacterized protein n=1 Tax=Hevea brasiliensis TaxID=3981 RepID=A0A6A6NK11_HEVBR|nr:hypothetical protein GH714_030763 [Hevea brasiliensis]
MKQSKVNDEVVALKEMTKPTALEAQELLEIGGSLNIEGGTNVQPLVKVDEGADLVESTNLESLNDESSESEEDNEDDSENDIDVEAIEGNKNDEELRAAREILGHKREAKKQRSKEAREKLSKDKDVALAKCGSEFGFVKVLSSRDKYSGKTGNNESNDNSDPDNRIVNDDKSGEEVASRVEKRRERNLHYKPYTSIPY